MEYAKGDQVKNGAQYAERDHKTLNKPDVPAMRFVNGHSIDVIAGNGCFRQVGQQIGQQYLLGQ